MPHRFRIQTLNSISPSGLSKLPSDLYNVGNDFTDPHALLLRSADLHNQPIPDSVLAVARAGAGTNNIPIPDFTARGVPVFNTPGANANAVKELVLASALMFARNLFHAALFARDLPGDDQEITKSVEGGKKTYVGFELPERTMGVVGLGDIGVQVANAAQGLGMRVVGYDPQIRVQHAWQLSREVERAETLEDVFRQADFLTVHVPLVEGTQGLVNTQRLSLMKTEAVVMNFARSGIVDDAAVLAALDGGRLRGYICDFPTQALKTHRKVIALPHLGASTLEAEDNCAAMAADELRSFLERGQLRNSVNFPDARLARNEGTTRLVIFNSNVPNMVGQVTTLLAGADLNIADLLNSSKGENAVTIVDLEGDVPPDILRQIRRINGVLSARVIPAIVTAAPSPAV